MIVEIDEFLNAVELEKAGKAKLPKINLKKFHVIPFPSIHSGNHHQFASAVDDNPGLSDVDIFNYLRYFLEGPVAGAIRGLPLTTENHESVKAILKKRFGQPQIFSNH